VSPALGDFGVVRTGGTAAKLIRFGTRSTVNHAFVYIGGGCIVEAQPGGAVVSSADKYPLAVWAGREQPQAAHHARQLVGTPYGWLDIAALSLACAGIGDEPNNPIAQIVERDNRLICSQLVDRAYLLAGVHLFDDGRLSGQVTPGDLLDLITR
jgi:cell wall-associated NlpC family hydrolase